MDPYEPRKCWKYHGRAFRDMCCLCSGNQPCQYSHNKGCKNEHCEVLAAISNALCGECFYKLFYIEEYAPYSNNPMDPECNNHRLTVVKNLPTCRKAKNAYNRAN